MGVGFGLMYCPAIVIVTMYFEKRRSLATGIAVAGAGVGTVLFSPINDFIITNFGWRAVFHTFLEPLERRRCDTIGERSVGYLNKKDVFYTGSITNVAEFAEHPDRYRSTGSLHKRSMSLSSAGSGKLPDVKEGSEESSEDSAPDAEGRNMFKTISNMLSLSLLVDPTFLIFAISNLLTSVGFNSPLYFLPLHAERGVGLDSASSSRVLSAFGLFNTLGRVVFG
ncbi:hypothetical protein OESDEN_12677, partial [Oesophagostomum dentatum]